MTEKEFGIVEWWLREAMEYGEERHNEPYEKAIQALEEIQQYRAIGTVEECTKAVLNIEHFYMLGRNEAVDEFAGQLKKKYPRMEDCFGIPNVNYTLRKNIDEIAEQMKDGEIVKDLASEHNNGWISVADMLPEDNQCPVLACTRNDVMYTAVYDAVYDKWYDDNFEREIFITDWQPLPPAPKKGE